ncbi:MAG TPA: hypothetical protein VGI07_13590 [Solirubrobacteraceae bacterium]
MTAAAHPPGQRPELAALQIADPPSAWQALGFTVVDGVVSLGGIELWLDASGHGITGWTLRRVSVRDDVDGLPTGVTADPPPEAVEHPNGALGLDQVVITTPDFDRTSAALVETGIPLRRIVDTGAFRQGFRRLGPAILELVEVPRGPAGPARFWGLVVTVPDLYELREQLAPWVGEIRDAVQPGRRIASLSADAGLSPKVAFMNPE